MNDTISLESYAFSSTYDRRKFEHLTVMLEKGSQDQGFGIAISGGKDGAYEYGGDPSILVSDVIDGSPADTLVRIGDILLAINGTNVECVNHSFAVDLLRSLKKTVYLLLKRSKLAGKTSQKSSPDVRVAITPYSKMRNSSQTKLDRNIKSCHDLKSQVYKDYQELTFKLTKGKKGFGLYLGNLIYVKEKIEGSSAYESDIQQGDIVFDINDVPVDSCKSTDEVLALINKCGKNLKLSVHRPNATWLPEPLTYKTPYVSSAQSKTSKQILNKDQQKGSPIKTIKQREQNVTISDKFKQELDESVRKRLKDTSDAASMSRSKSYSIGNYMKDSESEEEGVKFRKTNTNIAKDIQVQEVDYINPVVNQVQSKNYGRARSSSNTSALNETRTIRITNIGEHLGIQLIGGNALGIFIASVMENSPAENAGVLIGDQVNKVNGVAFNNITREDAVMTLLSLRNGSVTMKCTNRIATFEKVKHQQGDDFFIRVNFNYLKPTSPKELTLRKGELIQIRDSMYGGTVGSWWGTKISLNDEARESGVIPNKGRAEQLAVKTKLEEKKNTDMKKKLRSSRLMKNRSEYQSQDKLDAMSFNEEMIHIPAYVTVVKKAADFKRPVVLVGLASDVFRDYFKMKHETEFDYPFIKDFNTLTKKGKHTVSLHEIRTTIYEGKHCLLDISAQGIELLHHVNIAPIVILIKISERKLSSEFRAAAVSMVYGKNRDPLDKKEIKNINRYGVKINKKYSNYLTSVLEVFEQTVDQVYVELINIIRVKQQEHIYVSDKLIDEAEIESIALNEPDYASTCYTSASDSGTEDEESIFVKNEHDKVLKPNKYEQSVSQDYRNDSMMTNFKGSQEELVKKDSGRYIDIKYDEKRNNPKDQDKTKYNVTSYKTSTYTTTGNKITNEKGKVKLELTLNGVLKVPADGEGGLTESPGAKVSLYVPPGAFTSKQKEREFFIKVYLPRASKQNKGLQTNVSPVVVCGPEGIKFTRSIELRMPMNDTDSEDIPARIYTTQDYNADFSLWQPMPLNYPGSASKTFKLANNMIAILIDQF